MNKRIISLLILCFMVLSVALAACNDDKPDTSSPSNAPADQSQQTSEETSKEPDLLVPHLGKRDLGGFTLTFLACEPDGLYNTAQFAPEELNEEPINDAVYNRNERVKSEYNCEIEVIWTDSFGKYEEKVERDVLSGINDYNVLVTGVQTLAQIAAKNYLYDLNSIENSNLHLEESWWDQSANTSMTICERLFFATGDITVYDDQCTQCIYFNKDMIRDKGLDNPYQLVYDGEWTIDVMHEMCRDVAVPDGDGVMNMSGEDTWGFVGVAFDTYKLIIASNCPQIERDSNGDPVIAIANERNVNAFNKVYDFMNDNSCVAWMEKYYAWNDYDRNHVVKDHFYNGNALFLCDLINAVGSENMSNVTFNYGVLPTPKYDENQDYYVDGVDPYRFYAVSIPMVDGVDLEKTTFVLEALAYLSENDVTPVYYELTLKNKRFGTNDDDAPQMLDIIFQNRCVDLSVIFNWNDCIQYYNQLLTNNIGVLSFMESKGTGMQVDMDQCIEQMRAYKN